MNMPAAIAFPGLMHPPPESDEPHDLSLNEIIMSFHAGKPYFAWYTHVPEWEAEQIREGKLQGPVQHPCHCCGKIPENSALMATQRTVLCDSCWGAISPLI